MVYRCRSAVNRQLADVKSIASKGGVPEPYGIPYRYVSEMLARWIPKKAMKSIAGFSGRTTDHSEARGDASTRSSTDAAAVGRKSYDFAFCVCALSSTVLKGKWGF